MRKNEPTLRYFKLMKLFQSLPPIGVLVLAPWWLISVGTNVGSLFPIGVPGPSISL